MKHKSRKGKTMIANDPCSVVDSLSEEAQQYALALTVMTNRMSTLPEDDREDVFKLMSCWSRSTDSEERTAIKRAMIEILTQAPITVTPMPSLDDRSELGKSKTWATHVGTRIRKLREQAGLSQSQLAEKAGLPQSHISRIETATYTATYMTLEKIAKALDVSVKDLDPTLD